MSEDILDMYYARVENCFTCLNLFKDKSGKYGCSLNSNSIIDSSTGIPPDNCEINAKFKKVHKKGNEDGRGMKTIEIDDEAYEIIARHLKYKDYWKTPSDVIKHLNSMSNEAFSNRASSMSDRDFGR